MYGFTVDSENIYMLLEACLQGNLYNKVRNQAI